MPHHDPFALRELLGADAAALPARDHRRGRRRAAAVHRPPRAPAPDRRARARARTASPGCVDLGGDPVELARRPLEGMPRVAYAGAFLTAPGGYPVGRSWAPPAIVREVSDPSTHPGVAGGAATAVDEQASFGASVIKVALNCARRARCSTPPRSRRSSTAARAHRTAGRRARRRRRDGAHRHRGGRRCPGPHAVHRAARPGAHRGRRRRRPAVDLHARHPSRRSGRAIETARRTSAASLAAGGGVLYGTDLGNGDLPVGVNARELAALHEAGVQRRRAAGRAHRPLAPRRALARRVATFVPGRPPADVDAVPAWLGRRDRRPHRGADRTMTT